ncbi:MAG: flagellar brake domain-containing protein [Bacillota bacterium]
MRRARLEKVIAVEFEDILAVNRRITLVVLEGHNTGSYPSRIEDVGSDAVIVAAPTNEGSILELSEGDRVQIQVFRKDAMYSFDSVVEAVIIYPFPMLQLALPAEIERHQRRRYARVDTALPARYRCTDQGAGSRLVPYKGTATNVSGGGVLIVTRHFGSGVEAGSYVEVELELPEGKVYAGGVVVRASAEEKETEVYLKIAVEFKDIDERQRDMLVKYVLQRQLELRRKGLL